MALTPEDVVNKRFQPTKFREGYDQDEVDDFLDEVVVELRRLNQENEELRQRLMASDQRINELQRQVQQGAPMAQAPQAPVQPEPVAAPAPAVAPAFGAAMDASAMDPNNTNNLLQLARRLHEEHVREGVEKRDALIAEGHAAAARVVAEAEQRQRAQLGGLEQERVQLEQRIDQLRSFEREYRQKLKGYIEGQLRELDSTNELTSGPQSAQPAQAFASAPAPTAAPVEAAPQYAAAPAQPFAAPQGQPPVNYTGGFAGN
jgi:DivIVA domain-containing protein